MIYVQAYLTTMIVFFAIDYVWLGHIATNFYKDRLGHLMADQVNYPVAAGFYLIYIIGVVIFAVMPALKAEQWSHALAYGALFGFFAYATYDMTNMATLKDWPLSVTFVDVSWGTFLTGSAALAGYFLTRLLQNHF